MVTAFEQGGLDALCGLYSIVNALKLVLGKKADAACVNAALEKAVKTLDGLNPGPGFAGYFHHETGGMYFKQLWPSMIEASKAATACTGAKVSVSQLSKRTNYNLANYWGALAEHLANPNAAAIIGLSGRHDHWTVAKAVTNKSMTLYDSDGLSRLNRSRCAVATGFSGQASRTRPHLLYPYQTILLSA